MPDRMAVPVPRSTPAWARSTLLQRVRPVFPSVDSHASRVCLVGVRGYYRDSMGEVGRNDRGIWDDAIFVVSPEAFASFNANTDPSRWGINPALGKPYACLRPGEWLYRVGYHKRGKPTGHPAFVQAAEVEVERRASRDATDAIVERGMFGINIHRASGTTTSSEGCQTVPAAQWEAFFALVTGELKRHQQAKLPYYLMEAQG